MKVRMWLRYLMLPLPKIDTALPRTGNIYEIGCGKGIIASYVALSSQERQVTGIDTDQKKIKLSWRKDVALRGLISLPVKL